MLKAISLYVLAAIFSGASWWAFIFGQVATAQHTVDWTEIIQLGGTGGLIVSLLGATVTLWRERADLKKEFKEERTLLLQQAQQQREDHANYIERLQQKHSEELSNLTDKYTAELKAQISLLKQETSMLLAEERSRADRAYEQKE